MAIRAGDAKERQSEEMSNGFTMTCNTVVLVTNWVTLVCVRKKGHCGKCSAKWSMFGR